FKSLSPSLRHGTPGGTRTPNLRFWRPLLCQLSYWRVQKNWHLLDADGEPLTTRPGIPQGRRREPMAVALLDDLGNHARADRTAAFADREAQALVHRDRVDQRHRHLHVVARHHHLHALRQLAGAGDVGGAEVELRAIPLEERRVAAALVLRQHVDLGLELGVRLDRTRLAQPLAALDVVTLGAAQQQAGVVARLALVEQLAGHLHAGDRGLDRRTDADDLDFLAHLDDAALDAAGHHRATTRDREHVLDRH